MFCTATKSKVISTFPPCLQRLYSVYECPTLHQNFYERKSPLPSLFYKWRPLGLLGERRKKNDCVQLSTSTTCSRIMTLQSLNADKGCLQITEYKSRERKSPRCFTKHTLFNYSFILSISVKFKLGLIYSRVF